MCRDNTHATNSFKSAEIAPHAFVTKVLPALKLCTAVTHAQSACSSASATGKGPSLKQNCGCVLRLRSLERALEKQTMVQPQDVIAGLSAWLSSCRSLRIVK